MDISYIGILGGIILVLGSMWKIEDLSNPRHSIKNWLFGIGGLLMLLFSGLNYYWNNGSIFFVILQLLVNLGSVFMFFPIDEKKSIAILSFGGLGCLIWSLSLFEGYSTIFFILGLLGIAIGYTLKMGSLRRTILLFLGSVLIAIFSYLGESWIFFWLNLFFAIFSGHQSIQLIRKTTS